MSKTGSSGPLTTHRKRAAGALAALALALAACGGGDDEGGESFREDYRAESAKIERIGTDIAAAIASAPRRSDVDLARQFGDLAERTEGSIAALRRLDPPDDLTDERDDLVRALDTGADDLRDIATAANAGDAAKGGEAGQALAQDSGAIRDARRTLDRLTSAE